MSSIKYKIQPDSLEDLKKNLDQNSVLLCDENTYKHCLPYLEQSLGHHFNNVIKVPAGEESKNWEQVGDISQKMMDMGIGPDGLLVNLGGGVVSDLGGFVASIYKRGIDMVNIPTSLLAMADAAIGGKTGINLDRVKNQIGSYHFPLKVLIDTRFLDTLEESHLNNGMVELLKTINLQGEKPEWADLKNNLASRIREASSYKEELVKEDPYDKSTRKILNLGHSIGHALESYFMGSSQELLHGEAVLLGLYYEHLFMSSTDWAQYYKKIIEEEFPDLLDLDIPDEESIFQALVQDKKSKNASIQIPYMQNKSVDMREIDPSFISKFLIEEWLKK